VKRRSQAGGCVYSFLKRENTGATVAVNLR
jgi:hypothetical protein